MKPARRTPSTQWEHGPSSREGRQDLTEPEALPDRPAPEGSNESRRTIRPRGIEQREEALRKKISSLLRTAREAGIEVTFREEASYS